MAPAPLKTPRGDRLAFITYYKGEWKLHTKDSGDPIKEVDQEVQAAAEGLVDFQPDVPHEVVPENKRRKKHLREALPRGPAADQRRGDLERRTSTAAPRSRSPTCWATSSSPSRCSRSRRTGSTTAATRTSRAACTTGSTSTTRPTSSTRTTRTTRGYSGQDPRDLAIATQRFTGGQVFAEYPLDTFRRLEFGRRRREGRGAVRATRERRRRRSARSRRVSGLPCFLNNGWQAPDLARASCRRRRASRSSDRSPGSTFSVGVTAAPPIGGFLQRTTVDADLRKYLRLGGTTALLACAGAASTRPATTPTTSTSAATWSCAATTYLTLRGQPGLLRQRRAAASRSSTWRRRRSASWARCAARSSSASAARASTARRHGVSQRTAGSSRPRAGRTPTSSDPIFGDAGHRLPPGGRARLVRHRAAALLPRLPDALRLDQATPTSPRPATAGTSTSGSGTTSSGGHGGCSNPPIARPRPSCRSRRLLQPLLPLAAVRRFRRST